MHSSLPLRSSGSQSPQNETQQSSKAIEATIKDLRSRINDLEVILAPLQNMFVNTPGTVGNPRGWLEQTIKHTLAEIRTRSMLIEHYEGLKATYERIEAMPIPEPTTSKLAARPASSSSTTTSSLKKIKAKEHDSLQFKSLYLPGKRKAPINRPIGSQDKPKPASTPDQDRKHPMPSPAAISKKSPSTAKLPSCKAKGKEALKPRPRFLAKRDPKGVMAWQSFRMKTDPASKRQKAVSGGHLDSSGCSKAEGFGGRVGDAVCDVRG